MRLTPDLIREALSYINPLLERELDLRGHKIPAIENLGVAGAQDTIDFTDNDIVQLGNFPLSTRLRSLLLARNRIRTIQPSLHQSIPNLETLVLTQNSIAELADLDPLTGFNKLTYLSLLQNPVTGKEHYRYWVIWRCPTVRFLDFQKVKLVERNKAAELFGTIEKPTELASKIMDIKSNAYNIESNTNGPSSIISQKSAVIRVNEREKEHIEKLLKNAKSLGEIMKLEKELKEGRVPGRVDGGAKDVEMKE